MRYRRNDGSYGDYPQPLGGDDFARLADALDQADAVVPIRDVARGTTAAGVVALRHDVDHNLEHALRCARWEAARGWRSSYYVLPGTFYWEDTAGLLAGCHELQELGHEVGLHQDAVAEAFRRGHCSAVDGSALPIGNCAAAAEIVSEQLELLRAGGVDVVGTATHGSALWRSDGVTNAFLWATGWTADDFGLEYADAYHLHRRAAYVSDNRGAFPDLSSDTGGRQRHILIHWAHWNIDEAGG